MRALIYGVVAVSLFFAIALISPASPLADARALVYSEQHSGFRVDSGEVIRHDRLTAGHATLPIGSIVRVTNLSTREQIDVLINHRWTDSPSAIILTRAAATLISVRPDSQSAVHLSPIGYPIPKAQVPAPPRPNTPAAAPAPAAASKPALYFLEFATFDRSFKAKRFAKEITTKGAPARVVKDEQNMSRVISDGYFTSIQDASKAYYLVVDNVGYVPTIKKL